MITCGNMKAPISTLETKSQGRWIEKVPPHCFVISARHPPKIRPKPQERPDLVPTPVEFVDKIRSNKT